MDEALAWPYVGVMNAMRWLAVVALLFSACSVDDAAPVDQAEFSDNADIVYGSAPASITDRSPPINALWDIHILNRVGCTGVPIPVRMQFSHASTAFLAFSNGYSDESDWGMLGSDRVWLGERRISLAYVLEASVWSYEADGAMSATLHYYGSTECEVSVLATLE